MCKPINLTFMRQKFKKNPSLQLCALKIKGEEAGQSKNMS